MGLLLQKYHGFGNDYLIYDPNQSKADWTAASIQLVCNRNFGVGSDGILLGPMMQDGKIAVRIFNPDGSEAEKSGNGVMIFSKYLRDAGYVTGDCVEIDTLGGPAVVEYLDLRAATMRVNMGSVSFRSEDVPVVGPSREVVDEPMQFKNKVYRVTCVSVGNPHCVLALPTISKDLACDLGQRIVCAGQFPKGVNVDLMQVLDRSNLSIEVFERGAGYTLASGSSCCAAAAAAHRMGLAERCVTVHMAGGAMSVELHDDQSVSITGHVHAVCQMAMNEAFLHNMQNV